MFAVSHSQSERNKHMILVCHTARGTNCDPPWTTEAGGRKMRPFGSFIRASRSWGGWRIKRRRTRKNRLLKMTRMIDFFRKKQLGGEKTKRGEGQPSSKLIF